MCGNFSENILSVNSFLILLLNHLTAHIQYIGVLVVTFIVDDDDDDGDKHGNVDHKNDGKTICSVPHICVNGH